jgi:hypothetical protein
MNPLFCALTLWLPLAALFVVPVAPAGVASPKTQAPRFFTVTAIGPASCELRETGRTESGLTTHGNYKPEFRHLDITEAGGKKITGQEFARRAKVGTMVAVAADEHPVDAAYRAVLKPDTFVLHGVIVREELGAPALPVK